MGFNRILDSILDSVVDSKLFWIFEILDLKLFPLKDLFIHFLRDLPFYRRSNPNKLPLHDNNRRLLPTTVVLDPPELGSSPNKLSFSSPLSGTAPSTSTCGVLATQDLVDRSTVPFRLLCCSQSGFQGSAGLLIYGAPKQSST